MVITTCHWLSYCPRLLITDNSPGRGQPCHNSSFISGSVSFVTFVTLINTFVRAKAFREHLRLT